MSRTVEPYCDIPLGAAGLGDILNGPDAGRIALIASMEDGVREIPEDGGKIGYQAVALGIADTADPEGVFLATGPTHSTTQDSNCVATWSDGISADLSEYYDGAGPGGADEAATPGNSGAPNITNMCEGGASFGEQQATGRLNLDRNTFPDVSSNGALPGWWGVWESSGDDNWKHPGKWGDRLIDICNSCENYGKCNTFDSRVLEAIAAANTASSITPPPGGGGSSGSGGGGGGGDPPLTRPQVAESCDDTTCISGSVCTVTGGTDPCSSIPAQDGLKFIPPQSCSDQTGSPGTCTPIDYGGTPTTNVNVMNNWDTAEDWAAAHHCGGQFGMTPDSSECSDVAHPYCGEWSNTSDHLQSHYRCLSIGECTEAARNSLELCQDADANVVGPNFGQLDPTRGTETGTDVSAQLVYGCKDPVASNYSAGATADDGSCEFGICGGVDGRTRSCPIGSSCYYNPILTISYRDRDQNLIHATDPCNMMTGGNETCSQTNGTAGRCQNGGH